MAGMCGMSYYATSESDTFSHTEVKQEEEQNLMRIISEFPQHNSAPTSLELDSPIERPIALCGSSYSRRSLGLFSALMCGIWGGSCLVPMHYAKGNTGGLGYVISFSIGAMGEMTFEPTIYSRVLCSYISYVIVHSCDSVVLVVTVWISIISSSFYEGSICCSSIVSL